MTDATLLSDKSVVFARKTGAGKVTADKKLVWDYEAPKGFEVQVGFPSRPPLDWPLASPPHPPIISMWRDCFVELEGSCVARPLFCAYF